MKKYIYVFSALFIFTISVNSLVSCRKKGDTVALITVRDTANMLVPGARVILFGTSTTDPIQSVVRKDTATTNSDGVATFNFNEVYQLGQAGVAVLDIEAEKDDLFGKGIIKIEQEVVSDAEVLIQP
jgi:hypothetical protein